MRIPVVVNSSTASRPNAPAAARLSTGSSTAPVFWAASSKNRWSPPAMPQLTGEQKVLHALNRLTFGARPGDFTLAREQKQQQ